MKKLTPLAIAASMILITSCKKVYQCECKTFDGVVVQVTDIHDLGRYGAKNVCESYQNQNNLNGASQACSLK